MSHPLWLARVHLVIQGTVSWDRSSAWAESQVRSCADAAHISSAEVNKASQNFAAAFFFIPLVKLRYWLWLRGFSKLWPSLFASVCMGKMKKVSGLAVDNLRGLRTMQIFVSHSHPRFWRSLVIKFQPPFYSVLSKRWRKTQISDSPWKDNFARQHEW